MPMWDMIHPHLGRSCWFLVGQVARGRYFKLQNRLSYYSLRATRSAGGMRAETILHIQLVLRTDSRVLSEQAYERREKLYLSDSLHLHSLSDIATLSATL